MSSTQIQTIKEFPVGETSSFPRGPFLSFNQDDNVLGVMYIIPAGYNNFIQHQPSGNGSLTTINCTYDWPEQFTSWHIIWFEIHGLTITAGDTYEVEMNSNRTSQEPVRKTKIIAQ